MQLAQPGATLVAARSRVRPWLGPALLLATVAAAHATGFGDRLPRLLEQARGTGWGGLLVLGLLYVPATLAMVPAAALTVTAGLVFGPLAAFLVGVPAGAVAACTAFQAGRLMAGGPRFLARGEGRVARLARSLETRRGFWTVLLLRLSPVTPFAVLNYALGATPVRLSDFALATLLGSIPATLLCACSPALLGAVLGWSR